MHPPMHDAMIDMKQFQKMTSLLLAVVMLLGMVYFAPAAEAATASDYISTTYASNLSVKTTRAATLMEYPYAGSSANYTVPADTTLTVKALHKSTAGTYWYEVAFYNMTLYVDATSTTLLDHLTGDVSISDVLSPASLAIGDSFGIEGVITSTKNIIGTVTAGMYLNQHLSQVPVISASDTVNGKKYDLNGSAVDANLTFGSTPAGVYDYAVTVEAISYYIDDNGALATSSQNVVVERQQCVVTDWQNPNQSTAFGIDVSVWQGSIDWSKVKNEVDFVVLRIGFSETLDNRFLEYAAGCEQYDIPYGIYHYSYALTAADATAEGEWVINTLDSYGYQPELPIFFDMEDGTQAALSTSLKENICRNFCEAIRDGGRDPGFYGFTSWFSTSFITSYLNSMPVWIAQIDGFSSNGTATHDGGTWLWQYSWEGSISGISGDVDCNICYANFPGIDSSTDTPSDDTYLANCTEYPAHFEGKTTGTVNLRQYPSTSYSSLASVANGAAVEVTGVYKNSAGEYWYQVNYNGTNGYLSAGYVTPVTYLYDDLAVLSPAMASNLSVGASYNLSGELVSQYNNIYTAYAKIYSAEDTLATPVLSSSYNCNTKNYNLRSSTVDAGLAFGNLSSGYYTYEISADVRNYYVSGSTLTYKTENVVVWTAPFTVGSAAIAPPADWACDHNIVTDAAVAPTCTATGLTAGSHCTKCGAVFEAQTVVPATGHSYTATSTPANCKNYELFHYTCSKCGDSYDISADQLTSWSENKPVGVADSLIETKTQYRYADCTSTAWQQSGTGTVEYVNSWPSGFSTSNSLYTKYNKKSSKVTASETATTKTVINSDAVGGYLYYHWCYTDSYYSVSTSQGSYTTFHAYYSTSNPSNYTCDTSDYSYKTSHSTCTNTSWWFVAEVYAQKYTTYTAVPDGQEWGDWSAWSDTAYTAVENSRKVETRTVYRYTGAALGDHNWSNGSCSVCGTVCSHSFTNRVCTICGMGEPIKDYYLFGYINGANYGCEEDYATIGDYLFVDGKLTATFTADSYVAVKSADNVKWFMTNGNLGTSVTSAILYDSSITGANSDKLYVPKGREIHFTLVENTDGTLTLSYEIASCQHSWSNGVCVNCGESCAHNWSNSTCTVCGMTVVKPEMRITGASLSFESEVRYNIYFVISNGVSVDAQNMGLIAWNTPQSDGTIDNATYIIPGAETDGTEYMVHSQGIAAKYLADLLYFKIYIKLDDGSYVYGDMKSYSAKLYADNRLAKSTNTYTKALCVAMLNYGAAAQEYFGYKSYNLMNSGLTDAQKALVSDYYESMMGTLTAADSYKASKFVRSTAAFTSRSTSISFDGAFSINYYFSTGLSVDSKVTFYYWDYATYSSVGQLTKANATGSMVMTNTTGTEFWANVENIAAKEIDQPVYVAGVYTSGGVEYTTGIVTYSLGKYCQIVAAKTSSDMQDLAKATAVYGYYAKEYFANV